MNRNYQLRISLAKDATAEFFDSLPQVAYITGPGMGRKYFMKSDEDKINLSIILGESYARMALSTLGNNPDPGFIVSQGPDAHDREYLEINAAGVEFLRKQLFGVDSIRSKFYCNPSEADGEHHDLARVKNYGKTTVENAIVTPELIAQNSLESIGTVVTAELSSEDFVGSRNDIKLKSDSHGFVVPAEGCDAYSYVTRHFKK